MWAFASTHHILFIIGLIIVALMLSIITFLICKTIIRWLDSPNDFVFSKNGIIVKSKPNKVKLSSKEFISYLKEAIIYIEEAKEKYDNTVLEIKNRFFRQSKNFAKSRIESVKNKILHDYKKIFMEQYAGEDWINPVPTRIQTIDQPNTLNKKYKLENKEVNPCSRMCTGHCNSGVSFFDSQIQKDFKPILEEVYKIIEENHLINREDREYEEEIMCKSSQLASFVQNIVTAYPLPIDNKIATEVMEDNIHNLKEAIADALRRSRTLSKTKKEYIQLEKNKYIEMRNKQLSHIIYFINEEDLNYLLNDMSDDKISINFNN